MTHMNSDADHLDGRHLTEAAQRALRQRVLEAHKKGTSVMEIAEMLSKSRSWVYKVIASVKYKGEEAAVRGAKRGPKTETALKTRILAPRQEMALYDWIIGKNPGELNCHGALWTSRAIQEVVKKQFGIEMASRTVSLYMERWGMTTQGAAGRDSKEVQAWLESVYPTLEKKAKKEDALIVWQDETAIERRAGPLTENEGVFMISARNNQGKRFFKFQREAVSALHFVEFLNRLILEVGKKKRKLFVICDDAPLHHETMVREWTAEHQGEMELFFLPT